MEYVVDSEYMYRVSNFLEISTATGGGRRRRERLSVAHVRGAGLPSPSVAFRHLLSSSVVFRRLLSSFLDTR
jgi:hypothetical protein